MRRSTRSRAAIHLAATSVALVVCACAPATEPSWVIARPRELALRLEVVAQGPWGMPIDPEGPTASEALPGDTVRATPFIVGPDGPIAPDELDAVWALCDGGGRCWLRTDGPRLSDCDGGELVPDEPCELGTGGVIDVRLGDPPLPSDADLLEIATDLPTLALIASTEDGPGVEGCVQQIEAHATLEGCLLMERPIALGPLSEIIAVLEALGYEIDLSESLEPLLERPRNHNPGTPRFAVTVGDTTTEVDNGGSVSASVGDDVLIRHVAGPGDVEKFELMLDDTLLEVEETLTGRWFADREVEDFVPNASGLGLTWHASRPESVRFFFALRDDRGSEAGGWLTVDVGP